MSVRSARYRLLVQQAGVLTATTAGTDFILQGSLEKPLVFATPTVRSLEGRTEGRRWTASVVDSSGSITARLADSSGRFVLMNRVVLGQRSLGSTWKTMAGGRISDITMDDNPAVYEFAIDDEGLIVRQATIFNTTNTTRLYPPGPHAAYGTFPAPPKGGGAVVGYFKTAAGTKSFLLQFNAPYAVLPGVSQTAIEQDLLPNTYLDTTAGQFGHVRLRVGNSTYRIQGFGSVWSTIYAPGVTIRKAHPSVDPLADLNSQPLRCWILVASSTTFSPPTAVGTPTGTFSSAFLHMFGAPPSPATPLHIGTSVGIHPQLLKKQIWDGAFSSSGVMLPRYSSAIFDNGTTGVLRDQLPLARWRITGPENMADWIAQELNVPHGYVDLPGADGTLRPIRTWLPATTQFNSTGKPTVDASDLREPHPSWGQGQREQVTVLRCTYNLEDYSWKLVTLPDDPRNPMGPIDFLNFSQNSQAGGDSIVSREDSKELLHDRVSVLGRWEKTVSLRGFHPAIQGRNQAPDPYSDTQFTAAQVRLSREIFDRYGDGPVQGRFHTLSTGESHNPGDWVNLALATYPNAATQARGGRRLVQVLARVIGPDGCQHDYLDGGAASAALTAPTVVLALSTASGNRKHTIRATIATVPTGGAFRLQLAKSTGATAPASTSPLWVDTPVWKPTGTYPIPATTAGAYDITQRPSGTKHYARIMATKPGRVRSSWRNSTGAITTSGIGAVTGLTVSNVKALGADSTWAIENGLYPLEVFVDTSTGATFGASNRVARLPILAGKYPLILKSNQKHLVGVRHYDQWGGYGGADSTTVTSLTTGSTSNLRRCPPLVALFALTGTT